MHYLGLALYAEGPTDCYFLSPLLHRLCNDICTQEAASPVECAEVLGLDHPSQLAEWSRERRIVEAARLARGSWRIVFVHADGSGDPQRARAKKVWMAAALQRRIRTPRPSPPRP